MRNLEPDVAAALELAARQGLLPLETVSPSDARARGQKKGSLDESDQVGQIVDGHIPGPDGELLYRLFRPVTSGPHPIVVYFHGGGWVLGSYDGDDPFCRHICAHSGSIVISVDYRLAPEARFPAAVDDALAAVSWVADNTEALGGVPGQLAVAGWSSGANLAAVVCQMARNINGLDIIGQVLVNPVTDFDLSTGSYVENGKGYGLTTSMMQWFWDHYADLEQRTDPRAAPLRAASLANLPPAVVVTSEFDPLRDEGIAYAAGLSSAGVPIQHLTARGHTHSSVKALEIRSAEATRVGIASALQRIFTESSSISE